MPAVKPYMGLDGFIWFFGKVEDRDDPLQIGRVKVRVNGWYPPVEEAPKEFLPWAIPIQGIMSAALGGDGLSPTGIKVGSAVFGFFLDGVDAQQPVILGSYAGFEDSISDVNTLATGINNIEKTQVGLEPASEYATVYPFNKVFATESGHVIEIDDTPGAERIHIFHKSGSYAEISTDGRFVIKSNSDSYIITARDNFTSIERHQTITIAGDHTETIGGDSDVSVSGDQFITVDGDNTFNSAKFTSTTEGETIINASIIKLNTDTDVKGKATVSSTLDVNGKTNLNNSAAVTGATFKWNGATVVTDPIQGGGF